MIKCNADECCRRRLDGGEPLSAPNGSRCKRVPSSIPIKDGYFDRVTVLIVFAEKTLISGVSLTFKRIIKSYSAIYAPIRIERRIF